jgi:hypothetical protein
MYYRVLTVSIPVIPWHKEICVFASVHSEKMQFNTAGDTHNNMVRLLLVGIGGSKAASKVPRKHVDHNASLQSI